MLAHEASPVKGKKHYFENRDFDLASKVAALPGSAFVSPHEVAAITGIAATSFQKPAQRKAIGMPEPRALGRLLKWQLSEVRNWLQGSSTDQRTDTSSATDAVVRRGRPTKAEQLARAAQTQTEK
jgi:predicted DNA-binding transcriptional regulator AlpA